MKFLATLALFFSQLLVSTASSAKGLVFSQTISSLPLLFRATDSKLSDLEFSPTDGRTVLVFLSSECPCSDSYIEELNRLSIVFASRGVKFVGVHSNHNESFEKSQRYFANKKLNFSVIDDRNQKILEMLAAYKTPHAYIVRNRDRKVIYHGGVGSTRHAEPGMKLVLERALNQGESPDPAQTKTMGCMIERREM